MPARALALLLAALAALPIATACDRAQRARTLELEPCQLSAPGTPRRVAARCGRLRVAEDRALPGGRHIGLFVAVLPAVAREPEPDPLVLLAGGPGRAATESYLQMPPAFDAIRRRRDVVLVDQRGTGRSAALRCPQAAERGDEVEAARACLAALDADPRLYTTVPALDDLEAVRVALGAPRLNLYGVSYGTRVALAYLRRHPERVRTAVLDGVVPADVALGPEVSLDAERALALVFGRCAAAPACAAAFPDPAGALDALAARLPQRGARLRLAHPTSGEPTELRLTRGRLAAAVRLLAYTPETAALLPMLVHRAAHTGDIEPLAAQALLLEHGLGESISLGMHYAVLCSEDVPFQPRDAPAAASTLVGGRPLRALAEVCAHWPRAQLPSGFREPVASDVPVLLLSGEADPITPPRNGERAAARLRESLHVVAPGQGHGVAGRGCTPRLLAAFVEAGSTDGLDAACVESLEAPPFFVRMSGPEP